MHMHMHMHMYMCMHTHAYHTCASRYAAHNETFDWHDKDGNGHLDPSELEEYVACST